MTPAEVATKKATLDAHLAQSSGQISVAFGVVLFSELARLGHIRWMDFPNTAFHLKVPGAHPKLLLPGYVNSSLVYAWPDPSTPEDDYLVGKSA